MPTVLLQTSVLMGAKNVASYSSCSPTIELIVALVVNGDSIGFWLDTMESKSRPHTVISSPHLTMRLVRLCNSSVCSSISLSSRCRSSLSCRDLSLRRRTLCCRCSREPLSVVCLLSASVANRSCSFRLHSDCFMFSKLACLAFSEASSITTGACGCEADGQCLDNKIIWLD